MNPKIYRQADSRWKDLPYPTKKYKFGSNACGCCAVLHCAIEQEKYEKLTPPDVRKFMVQYATQGHGTLWKGITAGLEHYGYNVHWQQNDSMSDIWKVLKNSLKIGIILFGSTKGPDQTVWTEGGHYISFVDYKFEKNKHWFYLKDSGGRKHDRWWCYETSMAGDVRQVWICTSLKEPPTPKPTPPKPDPKPTPKPEKKYSGKLPTTTLKKGSEGNEVLLWQKFLNWYGAYGLKEDKVFGKLTANATAKFQKAHGLTDDKIVGPKTLEKAMGYLSEKLPKKCIDVSYWQGNISVSDWNKVKATCGYAIVRASYTSQSRFELNRDSKFANNFDNAKKAGLKVGAYHYSQALTVDEAKKEAEYICKILKDHKPTYFVAIDYEYGDRLNNKTAEKASEVANAFCDIVKSHGYQPLIYANTSTLQNRLKNPKYPVWVAQYSDKCTYKGGKALWQYTSSGKVNGITGKVDLSYIY